eukprot:Hpha_TRINITY_DN6794_c0_g2::TRINITY_DN6794_c0_g2_i1::g.110889::m.110889
MGYPARMVDASTLRSRRWCVVVLLLCFAWLCVTTGWQLQLRRGPPRDTKDIPPPPLPTTRPSTADAQCHAMPHTELHGDVVRWGRKEPSAVQCCEECLQNRRCNVWVYCDVAACGDKRGECWLKELADPFADIDLVRGRSDRWTSGTREPPPPQASRVRAAVAGSEAHLALVTEFGRIRLRLRDKSPKAAAWMDLLLQSHTECDGCTFYRAEPVPKHWGSLDWPDTFTGGRWGPPYALLQGGLSARGAPEPKAPREDNPVVRRGMVAWAGGGS